MKNIFLFLLTLAATTCYAQINTFYVAPNQTDPAYTASLDSHLVVRNTSTQLDKLFLFIGGTGSNPRSYRTISNFAGNLGYDVINLSYVNTVAAASLAGSADSLVFDTYRQEVCYGTPLSLEVAVDTFNSIYARTVKLLNHLNSSYPTQNWGQYLLTPDLLDWSKIVVGGHSQGSGHACYFGKLNVVRRVLLFSGPNDYSTHFSNSAKWLRTPGLTPVNQHYAYLSLEDEIVDFDKQLSGLQSLDLFPTYDTTYVDNSSAPYGNSRCLYTTQAPGIALLHHNSPIKFSATNNDVWAYMLDTTIISAIDPIEPHVLSIYPNPTHSSVHIVSNKQLKHPSVRVFTIKGQLVKTETIRDFNSVSIDLREMPSGLYVIEVGKQLIKMVKY